LEEQQNEAWRLWMPTPLFVILLTAACVVQAIWAPDWLISTRAGLQTTLTTLPIAVLALFALAFTTLFVAVQQVANVFSSRGPLILASDSRVRRIVARTWIVAMASLVLGALIKDSDKHPGYITAIGTTLLIASVWLIYSYGRFAYLLIIDYSSPNSFIAHVIRPVAKYLNQDPPKVGLVVFRVPLLGQTIRYALRRDDAETLMAALEGLHNLQKVCVDAAAKRPSVRYRQVQGSESESGWLGPQLRGIYTRACEEALRLQSPQEEIDLVVDYFDQSLQTFIAAHQESESKDMLVGLARLATTPYQITPGAFNYLSRPASALAAAERAAENERLPEVAILALANWAVTMLYSQTHFLVVHPLFGEGLRLLGENPPWESAIGRVRDPTWNSQWANQLGDKVEALGDILEVARDARDKTDTADFRRHKKSAYLRWLDVTQHLASYITDEDKSLADFARDMAEAQAGIDLVGTSEVRSSIRAYADSFGNLSPSAAQLPVTTDIDEQNRAIEAVFNDQRIVEAREGVLEAMSRDLGPDWQEER
jgi:hypothetical protein